MLSKPLLLSSILVTLVPTLLTAAPARIMPIGDSLTANEPGYRGPLFEMLTEAGCDVEFVGPKKGVGGGHAGFGGYTIGPGPSKADEWSNGTGNIYVNVEKLLGTQPDFALLLIGVNDYFTIAKLDPEYKPNQHGPERLAGLLDKIHKVSPKTRVLVSSILPVGWDPKFAQPFNEALPGLVSSRPFATFVDLNKLAGLTKGDWQGDNLHLSPQGEKKVAEAWFTALAPLLPKSEEVAAKAKAAKALAGQNAAKSEASVAPRGPQTLVWNFRSEKPVYGYMAWQKLDSIGKTTNEGWSVDASPDGGFGILFQNPLDLSKATNLVVKMKKEAGANSGIYVKLMCESGSRAFNIQPAQVPEQEGEIVLDLSKPSDGNGDLSVVKQLQVQGNFNKSQKFAYTISEIAFEVAP